MRKEVLLIKGKKGQQLNQREVNAIADGAVDGLLLFDVEKNGYKVNLRYNIEGLISYPDFLNLNNMSRRLFVVLLRNIILILKEIESNRFSKDLLMWSTQSMYVDPSSWHVYMMYVPLQPFETTGNLKTFLLEMVSLCNFDADEDIDYIQSLVQDLNGATAYTVGMLEAYCDKVSETLVKQKKIAESHKVCSACGLKLVAEELVCPFCGKRILSQVRTAPKDVERENSVWLMEEDRQGRVDELKLSPGAISINEDENGIVTIFRGSRNKAQNVWLEDCEHVGRISVTKFPFRIGKMDGVTDYRIYNNKVSRKHADILKEQGRYFVVDLGSTNGTYLNGKRIQPGVKEELQDGVRVTFADSEYKIHID